MRKYFDRVKGKIAGTRERMQAYWRRLMNHSTERKMSQGAEEIDRIIPSAHKDQWRRKDKK